MLSQKLDELIEYQDYVQKMGHKQKHSNILLQNIALFSNYENTVISQHQIETNLLKLIQVDEQNSNENIEQLQIEWKIICQMIKLTESVSLKISQQDQQKSIQTSAIELCKWIKQNRSHILQNNIRIDQILSLAKIQTQKLENYGNDEFSKVLKKYSNTNQTKEAYLSNFFNEVVQVLQKYLKKQDIQYIKTCSLSQKYSNQMIQNSQNRFFYLLSLTSKFQALFRNHKSRQIPHNNKNH